MHEHDEKVLEQIRKIEAAEARIKASKEIFDAAAGNHSMLTKTADQEIEEAWEKIGLLLKETGEVESVLPTGMEGYNYKISPRMGVETVDVPDIAAVPEKYIKTERTVKKKELLADLKHMRDENAPVPNYATITRGESKLSLTIVKDK